MPAKEFNEKDALLLLDDDSEDLLDDEKAEYINSRNNFLLSDENVSFKFIQKLNLKNKNNPILCHRNFGLSKISKIQKQLMLCKEYITSLKTALSSDQHGRRIAISSLRILIHRASWVT